MPAGWEIRRKENVQEAGVCMACWWSTGCWTVALQAEPGTYPWWASLWMSLCWAPCPSWGRHAKQNFASGKIASLPRPKESSVPPCSLLAVDFLLQSKCICIVLEVWLRLEGIPCNPWAVFLWFKTHTLTCVHTHRSAHACSHLILTRVPGGEKPTFKCGRLRLWGALRFLREYNGLIVQACLRPVAGRQAGPKLILNNRFRP